MKPLLFALLLLANVLMGQADGLDSLLIVQRARAGSVGQPLFSLLDSTTGLTADEQQDLRFLLAYMPLGDLAGMTPAALLENVRLARRARAELAWSGQVTDELYRHFILPHRVSQEPFVEGWRARFLSELQPRLHGLTMSEAALEVNHWCHEYVTYKPSDGRDQDPLTTMRAGLGRCEEEMIFTICALRSAGLPARQCYTPFWAHTDDNHAWVEVWADGRWYYYGACEPEPVLNRGWFSDAARRTMLVVSTAYGDYHGNEPVLRRYGSSTLINSTAVYGATRDLQLSLLDRYGKPVPKGKLILNLFNYGSLLPAMALETDSSGQATVVCGIGDWFITAGKDSDAALVHVSSSAAAATIQLGEMSSLKEFHEATYTPPVAPPPLAAVEQDSVFKRRLAREDSLREARLWNIWAVEAGVRPAGSAPDTITLHTLAAKLGVDSADFVSIMRGARGNWGTLYRFLAGCYPDSAAVHDAAGIQSRFTLLQALSDKDRRDFSLAALDDHFTCTQKQTLGELFPDLNGLDSTSRARVEQYVIAPRIGNEPSAAWRGRAVGQLLLSSHSEFSTSPHDSVLIHWLKSAIVVDSTRDRLGPPLTPAQVLSLCRGSRDDIERLYVALCRVRGIPARLSPITSRLERWDTDRWQEVVIHPRTAADPVPATGNFLLGFLPADSAAIYMKDWSVQVWQDDHLAEIDLGFGEPVKNISWPQELPAGFYCLTTGRRQADGSAKLACRWFEIKPGSPATAELRFRD